MSVKSKKLCTIILEYNNPQMTLETLRSLKKAKLPSNTTHQIFLIDNSPVPDGTLKKSLNNFKNVKYIPTHKNSGFAAGNNIGIKLGLKQKYNYFLLLNNDVHVNPSFLTHLFKSIKKGADIVVPKIYFAKGYEYHKDDYKKNQLGKVIWYAGGHFDWNNVYSKHEGMDQVDTGQFNKSKDVELANFCCVLIKKEVFNLIGLLDESYFLYWEDADFSVRAKKAGFKMRYQPQAKIWHKSSGSSGSGSNLHDYYLTRNRLHFGFKYAPFRTKLALVKESLRLLLAGRDSQKKGIMDYYLKRLGKGSFA